MKHGSKRNIQAEESLISHRAEKTRRVRKENKQKKFHRQKWKDGDYMEHNLIHLRRNNIVCEGDSGLYSVGVEMINGREVTYKVRGSKKGVK